MGRFDLLANCPADQGAFEGAGILHRDDGFERISGIAALPCFHHVCPLVWRRPPYCFVHEAQGMFTEADRIDDKLAVS